MAGQPTCLIDDYGPLPLEQPQTVGETSELVRQAFLNHQAIYPVGGQTMLNRGFPPSRPGYGIDMTHLSHVIDYPARDMTITVQAGITIAHLQSILQKENQRLP